MFTVNILGQTHELNERTPAIKLLNDEEKRYMAGKGIKRLLELNFAL